MTISVNKEFLSPASGVGAPVATILARVAEAIGRRRRALRRWRDRTAAVRQLTRLDERTLQDIGLSRHELAPLVEAWQAQGTDFPRWPQRWSD